MCPLPHLPRSIALIDGEHYPDVVAQALRHVAHRYNVVGAVFLGGTEKIKGPALEEQAERLYGVPVVFAAYAAEALQAAIRRWQPDCVVDLSDEPVLGYAQRFRLASYALAAGVAYLGSDFHFNPPQLERVARVPSLSVIGTAKRVGKTALSGFTARKVQALLSGSAGTGPGVVVVAMGRGGPGVPEVVDGLAGPLGSEQLLSWSRQGRHAASDHFEDAALSRVTTVGCRRCGGGLAGEPFVSNVRAGVEKANTLDPAMLILEGSGATIPPVASDARLCVAGAHQPLDYVVGYMGTYRLLISDAVVLAMAEEPLASREEVERLLDHIAQMKPRMPVVPVVFRPRPLEAVEGRTVAFFCTAPEVQLPVLTRHLEDHYGCCVRVASGNLADRARLRADLAAADMDEVDAVLTEIKAAAIDVVAEDADRRGLPVVFVDNDPVEVAPATPGELAATIEGLVGLARERFGS